MIKRILLSMLVISLLVGCSSPVETVKKDTLVKPTVKPISLASLPLVVPASGKSLATALIDHYQKGPAYSMSLPLTLKNNYQLDQTLSSPDKKQLMQLYKAQDSWGFVSIVGGNQSIMNAFELTAGDGQKSYALVLRGVRICLMAGADRAPFWGGASWVHSTINPGKFECSAQTRGSLYTPYSGMPGRLGIYFMTGDTVLYDTSFQTIQRLAAMLSEQFINLSVPDVN